MKKILSIALVTGVLALASCGGSNEAEKEKARQDSLAKAAREQAIQDSIAAANAPKDILTTAGNAGNFSTLLKAIEAAGLNGTLAGEGPFTVFAPTDAAFSSLPKGTLENLLKPENAAKLSDVLTFHVVGGSLKAADVASQAELTTVQGAPAKITVSGASVKYDKANISQTDIICSNGVIHVIDAVVLPPAGKSASRTTPKSKKEEPKKEENTGKIDLSKGKQEQKIDLSKGKGTDEKSGGGKIDLSKKKGGN
jgi:transforming growth factor-beta-induced protein